MLEAGLSRVNDIEYFYRRTHCPWTVGYPIIDKEGNSAFLQSTKTAHFNATWAKMKPTTLPTDSCCIILRFNDYDLKTIISIHPVCQ